MAISRLIAVLQKNGAVSPSSIEGQVVAQRRPFKGILGAVENKYSGLLHRRIVAC